MLEVKLQEISCHVVNLGYLPWCCITTILVVYIKFVKLECVIIGIARSGCLVHIYKTHVSKPKRINNTSPILSLRHTTDRVMYMYMQLKYTRLACKRLVSLSGIPSLLHRVTAYHGDCKVLSMDI